MLHKNFAPQKLPSTVTYSSHPKIGSFSIYNPRSRAPALASIHNPLNPQNYPTTLTMVLSSTSGGVPAKQRLGTASLRGLTAVPTVVASHLFRRSPPATRLLSAEAMGVVAVAQIIRWRMQTIRPRLQTVRPRLVSPAKV